MVKQVGLGCLAFITALVMISIVLVWAGAMEIPLLGIRREAVTQSQQYVTSHNQQILGLITDYESTQDPARRKAIVNQICLLASEIPGNVTISAQPFVSTHC